MKNKANNNRLSYNTYEVFVISINSYPLENVHVSVFMSSFVMICAAIFVIDIVYSSFCGENPHLEIGITFSLSMYYEATDSLRRKYDGKYFKKNCFNKNKLLTLLHVFKYFET